MTIPLKRSSPFGPNFDLSNDHETRCLPNHVVHQREVRLLPASTVVGEVKGHDSKLKAAPVKFDEDLADGPRGFPLKPNFGGSNSHLKPNH